MIKVIVSVDRKMAIRAGKSNWDNQLVEIDPELLTQKQLDTLASRPIWFCGWSSRENKDRFEGALDLTRRSGNNPPRIAEATQDNALLILDTIVKSKEAEAKISEENAVFIHKIARNLLRQDVATCLEYMDKEYRYVEMHFRDSLDRIDKLPYAFGSIASEVRDSERLDIRKLSESGVYTIFEKKFPKMAEAVEVFWRECVETRKEMKKKHQEKNLELQRIRGEQEAEVDRRKAEQFSLWVQEYGSPTELKKHARKLEITGPILKKVRDHLFQDFNDLEKWTRLKPSDFSEYATSGDCDFNVGPIASIPDEEFEALEKLESAAKELISGETTVEPYEHTGKREHLTYSEDSEDSDEHDAEEDLLVRYSAKITVKISGWVFSRQYALGPIHRA